MSATLYYFSTNAPAGQDRPYSTANSSASGSLNQGYSTSTDLFHASDYFELRIKTVLVNGTTKTGVTKRDVLNFLELARRWVLDSGGGSGDGNGQGLDYLIKANSGTAGVP